MNAIFRVEAVWGKKLGSRFSISKCSCRYLWDLKANKHKKLDHSKITTVKLLNSYRNLCLLTIIFCWHLPELFWKSWRSWPFMSRCLNKAWDMLELLGSSSNVTVQSLWARALLMFTHRSQWCAHPIFKIYHFFCVIAKLETLHQFFIFFLSLQVAAS